MFKSRKDVSKCVFPFLFSVYLNVWLNMAYFVVNFLQIFYHIFKTKKFKKAQLKTTLNYLRKTYLFKKC